MSSDYPTSRRPKRQGATVTADEYFSIMPERLLYDTAISDGAIRLYLVLRRYADKSGAAFPSRRTLSGHMKCSVDTVDRRVRELEEAGWLDVRPHFEGGAQVSNDYHLRTPGRTDAATPSGTDAATLRRAGAAQNESHLDPEPVELEVAADAARAATPLFVADEIRDQTTKPRADSEPSTDERARDAGPAAGEWAAARAVVAARAVPPRQGVKALAVLVQRFVQGGFSVEEVQAAMIAAATVSQGSVEVELGRRKPRGRDDGVGPRAKVAKVSEEEWAKW